MIAGFYHVLVLIFVVSKAPVSNNFIEDLQLLLELADS
jgi:hypothetical protein